MYLMALNNLDYIFITAFLGVIMLIAYLFRHQNSTSAKFLFLPEKLAAQPRLFNFGIIEFILAGMAGSLIGLPGFYYVVFALVISYAFQAKLNHELNLFSGYDFNDYLRLKLGKRIAIFSAVWQVLLFISLSMLAILLTFFSCQSLLGWNFVNSVLGIVGVTVVAILTGGVQSVYYNRIVKALFVLLLILASSFMAFHQFGGLAAIGANLQNLALKQGYSPDYYLGLHFKGIQSSFSPLYLQLFLIGIIGLGLLRVNGTGNNKLYPTKPLISLIGKAVVLFILIIPGLLAVATSVSGNNLADGRKIVTVQAQMPDGQMAYVVKAVNGNATVNQNSGIIKGIIPPLINQDTGVVEINKYDYKLANLVGIRYYLPKNVGGLLVVLLIAAFMLALSEYFILSAKVVVKDIFTPWGIIEKYGDLGKLWTAKLTILSLAALSLMVAFFATAYFDFILFLSLIIAIFVLPLFVLFILALLCKKPKKIN